MAASCLLKGILITGSEESNTVLIEDSTEHNGRVLLRKSLDLLISKYDSINVLLLDIPKEVWSQGLTDSVLRKLSFMECLIDPMGWNTSESDTHGSITDTFPFPSSSHGSESTALLVDNLSTLLRYYEYTEICRTVRKISRLYKKCIFIIHYDVHEDHVMQALHHMMSSVIRMLSGRTSSRHLCSIRHKRISGKILKEVNRYSFINDSIICEKFDEEKSKDTKPVEQVNTAIDPAANLTFDLRLTDRQKEERSRVVLPYIRTQQQQIQGQSVGGTGQIIYQLDEVDDWDESDPDDDLDI